MSQGRSVPARGRNGRNESQLQALMRLGCGTEAPHIEFDIIWVAGFDEIARFSAAC
jgi:hypothetical protein